MRQWLRRAPGLLLVGVTACAYYNGLYNANRLVGEAEKAQREGRSGEARSLWSQAAVKAESVATRYPKSKWRDDALYLWGQGLMEAGECRRAENPLALAVDSSPDPKLSKAWLFDRFSRSTPRSRSAPAIASADPTSRGCFSISPSVPGRVTSRLAKSRSTSLCRKARSPRAALS